MRNVSAETVQPRSLPLSPTKSGKEIGGFLRAFPTFIGIRHFLHLGILGILGFMAITVARFPAPLELAFQPDAERGKHQNQ